MKTWPNNKEKHWSQEQVKQLKELAKENTPTRIIGLKLGRTPEAIYSKTGSIGVSLHPTNQKPYGTRVKK